jgi:hypothetical protein
MSIIEQAKTELAAINFDEEGTWVMIDLLERFFDQWDSGGAVSVVAPVLMRLLNGQPLSPLTGADDEWVDPFDNGIMLQNKRCGSVFKDWRNADGTLSIEAGRGELLIHDIDAPKPFAPITFPYDPATRLPSDPVIELETGDPGLPWDAPSNRYYEPVERRAAEIYAGFPHEGPGEKPAWVPGGNSIKQDKARDLARKELDAAGHRA